MADIKRSAVALPTDISNEIIQKTTEQSAIMRLARRITLPGNGVTIPMITGEPTAEWVEETGAKPVSNPGVNKKIMQAYKLAVIETFSKEFTRDLKVLYDALVARMPAALAFCASLQMEFSTSDGAAIIRSANSSMMITI